MTANGRQASRGDATRRRRGEGAALAASPAGTRRSAVQIAFLDGLERHVRLGLVLAEDILVREHDPALWARITALAEDLRRRLGAEQPADLPTLRQVRAMYHATGVDPTKRRPSSEALLRRVLRGQALHPVNTLVDLCNYLSLKSLLPIGLYNLDRIQGDAELRLGREAEPYEAIGRESFSVGGRMVLADRLGPFGSPTSDSTRTMITLATRRAMAVFYSPLSFPVDQLTAHLAEFAEGVRAYCAGEATAVSTAVLPEAGAP